jgi:hypothetical protein
VPGRALAYDRIVAEPGARRAVLSSDTSAAAEAVQVRAWRSMSSREIAALVDDLSSAARAIALARIRSRRPGATPTSWWR